MFVLKDEEKDESKWYRQGISISIVTSDSRVVIAAEESGRLILWDIRTGIQLRELSGHQGMIWSLQLSSDGKRLLTASSDASSRVWNLSDGRQEMVFDHPAGVSKARFLIDGKHVITMCDDNAVRIWDAVESEQIQLISLKERFELNDIIITPDEKWLVIVGEGIANLSKVYDISSEGLYRQAKQKQPALRVAQRISRDGDDFDLRQSLRKQGQRPK